MKYTITSFTILVCFLFSISFSHAQTKSFKRGVGYNVLYDADLDALRAGLAWGYNWGHTGSGNDAGFKKNGVEFVPMVWNGNYTKEKLRNFIINHPETKYILAFNEPNFTDQANMTPEKAAERWPEMQEVADEFGLTIVGPALNFSNNPPYQDPFKWYDEFFSLCKDCRVDHIAVHLYMGSAGSIASNIEKYKKYGKPIWLTEFCAWETGTTQNSQKKFLVETLDYLEKEPMVYRYAWFKERGWDGKYPYMQLLSPRYEGVLIELGKIFTHMSSYDDNFYFSLDQRISNAHYIRMSGIHLEETTDESGHINLSDFDVKDWVEYNVNVPEDGEYNLFFRVCAEYNDDSQLRVSVNQEVLTSYLFEKKGVGNWNTQQCKVNLKAGKQKIRLDYAKGGLKMNWWAISKSANAPSSVETTAIDKVAIFPNPVKDMLYLQLPADNSEVSLYDVCGKLVYSGKNVTSIDMNSFNSGLYILDVRYGNGGRAIEKILKENN